jgi:hypothetical protein
MLNHAAKEFNQYFQAESKSVSLETQMSAFTERRWSAILDPACFNLSNADMHDVSAFMEMPDTGFVRLHPHFYSKSNGNSSSCTQTSN